MTIKWRAYALALFLATPTLADPVLIESFDSGNAGNWRFFTDQVMGGVSTGQAEMSSGALTLRGAVSTKNNGGFIQVRRDLDGLSEDTTALVIRVRGDGQRYFLHLRTAQTRMPWHYYQAGFETSDDWQVIRLPLSAFEPSNRILPDAPLPEDIRSVALVAYGRDHDAQVSLSEIRSE